MVTKICSRCGQEKPNTAFYNDRSIYDGKSRICKMCQDIKNKQYKIRHAEKVAAYQQAYREQHCQDNIEYQRQYQQDHKVQLSEKHKEYYRTHKDKWQERSRRPDVKLHKAARNKEAYARNQEEYLERNRRWRQTAAGQTACANAHAKRRANIGDDTVSVEEWRQVMATSDWKCVYCQVSLTPENRSIDHVIPLSRGGKHCIVNLVACCRTCNSKKGNKSVSDFVAEIGVLYP